MSAAIVTGAYATVASALDYWINLSHTNGATSDAYLTQPVGVNTLNFGKHAIKDLSAYNNPDGINGILAYTAVPAFDVNNRDSLSTPPLVGSTDQQNGSMGGTQPPAYARVSIGNAIASIEGTVAIQYLLNHKIFPLIDSNSDGIITAQEIQNFTDTAATKGLAEAGAMARLLGGTSSTALPETGLNNTTWNENPDQPAVLQRRFNYFDYLANGQLKGGISIQSFKMLARTLLPLPDQYVIVDRQRASANGYLVDPTAQRNFVSLQQLLPSYMWVPKSARASWKSLAQYRNVSPARFGIDRNVRPGTTFPLYTLFAVGPVADTQAGDTVVKTNKVGGQSISVAMVRPVMTTNVKATPGGDDDPGVPDLGCGNHVAVDDGDLGGRGVHDHDVDQSPSSASTTTSTASTVTPSATSSGTGGSSNNASALLDALLKLAQQGQSSSTAAGQTSTASTGLSPAGTLTPVSDSTGSTTATTSAGTTPAAATTTSSTTTAAGNSASTSASSTTPVTAAALTKQAAAQKLAVAKAQAKKSKGFWSDLANTIKKPFG